MNLYTQLIDSNCTEIGEPIKANLDFIIAENRLFVSRDNETGDDTFVYDLEGTEVAKLPFAFDLEDISEGVIRDQTSGKMDFNGCYDVDGKKLFDKIELSTGVLLKIDSYIAN